MTISKSIPAGSYKIPERDHVFCIHKKMNVNSVIIKNQKLTGIDSGSKFNISTEGWWYDRTMNSLWIKLKCSVNEPVQIQVLKE